MNGNVPKSKGIDETKIILGSCFASSKQVIANMSCGIILEFNAVLIILIARIY